MRDPNRIDNFLKIIEKIWKSNPDLRFNQLVLNAIDENDYYLEDDESLEKFKYIYGISSKINE